MSDAPFACRCGRVAGTMRAVPKDGFHFACHCGDCRASARLAGADDPGTDGVAVYHTTPDKLTLAKGRDLLEPLRMRPTTKLMRWRARCCGDVPLVTADRPGIPVVSVVARAMPGAPLGPLRAHTFMPPAKPGGRQRNTGLGAFLAGFARRTVGALVSGRWRANPLAAGGGYPAARDLTPEERARAYAKG